MSKLDDLGMWRVFLLLAQTRNFTHTADMLDVDGSTVSRILSTLENLLGRQLMVRNSRPLQLTKFGVEALEQMSSLLERHDAIISHLRLSNTFMEGVIRIASPYSLEMQFLGEAMLKFRRRFPKVRFKVTGGGVEGLTAHTVDLVFASSDVLREDWIALPRRPNLYVPIASKKYIEQHGYPRNPNDITKRTVFYFEGVTRSPTTVLRKGEKVEHLRLENSIVMSNILAIKENVLSGKGICVDMPFFICAEEIAAGSLVPILNGWHRPPLQTYVISTKATWHSKIHRVFMDWIQKELIQYFDNMVEKIKPFWHIPEMETYRETSS